MSPLRIAPFLVFLAFPLVELVLLIKAGETLGFWPTIGILFGSAVLGVFIIRQQGLSMVARMMSAMNEGRLPFEPLLDGYARIMAGILLILPGLLSDALGLLLLVPPVRKFAIRSVLSGFVPRRPPPPAASANQRVERPTVIEGTYERIDEHDIDPPERR